MILFRLISWPDASKHLMRSVLSVSGIALGIAIFVAMSLANSSVLSSFTQTVDKIAGSTELQVSGDESGFEEGILEKVQAVPAVRVAVPVIEAVVSTGLKGQGNLKVLAVDMTGDGNLRNYQISGSQEDVIEDPLVFLAQPDSIVLSREFATRNGLKVGDKFPLTTMDGLKQFTVRGIMKPGGLASAFGGNIAVMDIYAAQKIFGRGRKFDRVDLALQPGTSLEEGGKAIRKAIGPGYDVDPPAARGHQFESLLRVYSFSTSVCSVFAVFIAMFIIYTSMLTAVTRRRKEIGILRALGATRTQIEMLFVGESAVAGLVGSLLGLGLGVLLAGRVGAYMAGMMQAIYGVLEPPATAHLTLLMGAAAVATGVAASMISAWVPARTGGHLDPAVALQKGLINAIGKRESRMRQISAGVLAVISAGCLAASHSTVLFYIGYLLIAVVSLLLAPTLSLLLARILRAPFAFVLPVEGSMATDSIIEAPRRTSATVGALMFSVAMAIGLAGSARSTFTAVNEWVSATFNAPLFVSASEVPAARSFHFPGTMLPQLQAIPGVAEVQSVRNLKVTIHGKPALLTVADLVPFSQRTRGRRVAAGDYDQMHLQAAQGKGVVVSENFAELQKLKMGDPVELTTPRGPLRLPIVGMIKDFSQQEGTVFLDRSVMTKYWNDESADIFRIYLRPDATPEAVRAAIMARFERERRLFVLSTADARQYVLGVLDQWFAMTYIQIAIAVLVAILGILNTLTVSITERKRELGVLRAIGGMPGQIRRSIWMEAFAIATVGLLLGFALGAVNLYYTLEMVHRQVTGFALVYEFPWRISFGLVPIMLLAALLVSTGPAEYAVHTNLVEALEYE